MRIILAAREHPLADAWRAAMDGIDCVSIHSGSILNVACDAVVSPANSYGFMDGGIDLVYSQHFGWGVEDRLRQVIKDRHRGELLVGAAELIETGNLVHPYLIAAPTMRVPMVLGSQTVNPFLATRAVLLLVKHGVFQSGGFAGARIAEHVQTIAFPGLGTGVGQVPVEICARQMRAAIEDVLLEHYPEPTSWAEASERHQLLFMDRAWQQTTRKDGRDVR
jgi:O-acetyl-ADP-ribose deacetylase (regulator of RNase III)